MKKFLTCSCGTSTFRIRLRAREAVALLTCAAHEHTSLLLDSRDYWHSTIQDGRPPETRCTCGSKEFAVELDYELRDDGSVRTVNVTIRCASCGRERPAMSFEIDYSPTDVRIDRPLDPIDKPWLKAKQHELTGLWRPSDALDVARHLVEVEALVAYLAAWNQPVRAVSPDELQETFESERAYSIVFSSTPRSFVSGERDLWMSAPVIALSSPMHINYANGVGHLYFLRYADEIFDKGIVVQQPSELRACTSRLRAWLAERFVTTRGKRAFDASTERDRLFPIG